MVSGIVGFLGNYGGSELVRGVLIWGFKVGVLILYLSRSFYSELMYFKIIGKEVNFSLDIEE